MSYENPFPRNRLKTRVFTSKTPNLRGLKETWVKINAAIWASIEGWAGKYLGWCSGVRSARDGQADR
jgi:hypothetical protein